MADEIEKKENGTEPWVFDTGENLGETPLPAESVPQGATPYAGPPKALTERNAAMAAEIAQGVAPEATHVLKTDPEAFDAVKHGEKTFEIRFDDRGFKVGDLLHLRRTQYTGAEMREGAPLIYNGDQLCVATYILRGPIYGLADQWVVIGIRNLAQPAPEPLCVCGHGKHEGRCRKRGDGMKQCPCDRFRPYIAESRAAQPAQGEAKHAWRIDGQQRYAVCLQCGAEAEYRGMVICDTPCPKPAPAQAISAEEWEKWYSAYLDDCEAKSKFFKNEGDMYGYNFWQGQWHGAVASDIHARAHAAQEVSRVEGELAELRQLSAMEISYNSSVSAWVKEANRLRETLAQKEEEASRLLADKTRAENTLLDAGYTYKEGATAWKPPINYGNGRLWQRVFDLEHSLARVEKERDALFLQLDGLQSAIAETLDLDRTPKDANDARPILSSLAAERDALKAQVVEDKAILDWLETQVVEVREPLRYGSRQRFITGPADDEFEDRPSDLRSLAISTLQPKGQE